MRQFQPRLMRWKLDRAGAPQDLRNKEDRVIEGDSQEKIYSCRLAHWVVPPAHGLRTAIFRPSLKEEPPCSI